MRSLENSEKRSSACPVAPAQSRYPRRRGVVTSSSLCTLQRLDSSTVNILAGPSWPPHHAGAIGRGLCTTLGCELRRINLLGTSANNEATSQTLRMDVAGAIIFHSLCSFLEGRERRRSPQSRLSSRSLFRRSRTYTPPALDPPSPCIF